MMSSIVRLSSNRSWARTNQNARITWVIIKLTNFNVIILEFGACLAQNNIVQEQ